MSNKIVAHQYWFCNPFSWIRLLYQNNGVHPAFYGKAILITGISLISYPFQLLNSGIIWWKKRRLPKSDQPIFIIGHWRGGTTFLQYLLAEDKRFGYLTYFHAFIPNLAIIGGNFLKRILGTVTPAKRPQDNIHIEMDLPTEEENPLSTYSTFSASHSFFFPHNEDYYRKYVLFDEIGTRAKEKWQKAYSSMLSRIAVDQKGKQLIIKNPHNTGRIRELLELYPKARFIHIYRNPYDIYPSTYLMYDLVVKTQFLQKFSQEEIEEKIIYYFRSLMTRYFQDKALIPEGQLIELKFEEFVNDPMEGMVNIYKKLDMDLSEETLTNMKRFVKEMKGYKKNKHQIPQRIKEKIEKEWAFGFEKLGYPIEPSLS